MKRGWFKTRKPSNKLCGVTTSVLNIATIGKLSTKEGHANFDFKGNMEFVRLVDFKEWRNLNLLDNWALKRMTVRENSGIKGDWKLYTIVTNHLNAK